MNTEWIAWGLVVVLVAHWVGSRKARRAGRRIQMLEKEAGKLLSELPSLIEQFEVLFPERERILDEFFINPSLWPKTPSPQIEDINRRFWGVAGQVRHRMTSLQEIRRHLPWGHPLKTTIEKATARKYEFEEPNARH